MSRRLEESLRKSLSQLPQADLGSIINTDIIKLERHNYITRQEYIPRKGVFGRVLFTAVSSALIIGGICVWLLQSRSVSTMVTLDINAGFIITASSGGGLLKVRGVDNAALSILKNIDYSGLSLTDVTGELVSASADLHYLSNENHYILISVWDKDQGKAQLLLTGISGAANRAAAAAQINPEVLGQYLVTDGSLEQDAQRLGVTEGRLQLMDTVSKYKPSYTTDLLTRYSLENLLKIASAADIPLPVSGYQTVSAKPAS